MKEETNLNCSTPAKSAVLNRFVAKEAVQEEEVIELDQLEVFEENEVALILNTEHYDRCSEQE